jgi:hypothetical protein
MSVRAYRINTIDYEDVPTWNTWHEDLIGWLMEHEDFWDGRNDDGVGIIEVSTDALKKALAALKAGEITSPLGDAVEAAEVKWVEKQIRADLKWAKANVIQYYCL